MRNQVIVILLTISVPAVAELRAQPPGILNDKAPSWDVAEWINLEKGTTTLEIEDFRGKVLYLYCFQSWCPGCHSSGFPTLRGVMKRYEDNPEVAFVAIQTVFEGYASNTFDHARKVADKYDLKIPVGQSGQQGQRSQVMRRYRSGGTPWTVVIDRAGVVRFNDFHISVSQAGDFIDQLLADKDRTDPGVPESRGGRATLGTKLDLSGVRWLKTHNGQPVPTAGKVTLVRWWTDTCPFCAASLPAITKLRGEFGDRNFETVGVYHPKPPRDVTSEDVVAAAKRLSYTGPLAVDHDWKVLESNYLSRHPNVPTSVSFLLDRGGKIRYVHPGPIFYPNDDPDARQENADYEDIRAAIGALLEE